MTSTAPPSVAEPHAAEPYAAAPPAAPAGSASFDAFVSYSHAADGKLAPALQRALHDFAKPWYQLRALRVFRDKTSLAANPALWPAIEAALADSRWFLYLASPSAARSRWVQQEVSWWLEHRTVDRMLVLLTDGELAWDAAAHDYDWNRTTAVPESLRGRFRDEPLYVDLRWARTTEKLSLRHSQFRAAVLDIAAPLRGRPKEDLDGEDVRQHRRNRAWAWSAAAALAVLAVLAVAAALAAVAQRREAVRQRDEALGRLYAQQLARVGELAGSDPVLARDVLDETLHGAGALREFTWDLYARLAAPPVLALGGVRDRVPTGGTGDEMAPVVALSPDGGRLATASVRPARASADSPTEGREIAVHLWDAATGALVATLPLARTAHGDDERATSVAFSPDGRELAASAGSFPSVVKVWDAGTGRELLSLQDSLTRRVLLPSAGHGVDGSARRLVTVSELGERKLWSGAGAGTGLTARPLGSAYAAAVERSPDGRYLLAAGHTRVDRWDVATGAHGSVPNPASAHALTALSPDGARVARADGATIEVWRLGALGASGDSVEWRLERGHNEGVRALAFSPDGRVLASGGADGVVRLWDLARGAVALTLRGPQGAVSTLAFSGDGRRLAAGGADATVFVWEIGGGPLVRPAERVELRAAASCAAPSAERAALVAAVGDTLAVHAPAAPPARVPDVGVVRACGVARDGTALFAIGGDGRVVVADARTGAVRGRTDPVADPASVRIADAGDVVAARVAAGTFAVWDATTGRRLATVDVGQGATLDGPFELVAGSTRGIVVAQFTRAGGAWVGAWDARTGRRRALVATPPWSYGARAAVCAPNGAVRPLLASTVGNALRVVDLASGTVKRHLAWRSDGFTDVREATALAFSPDCATLALGDQFGAISAWDVASGARRWSAAAHTGERAVQWRDGRGFGVSTVSDAAGVAALAFSPDGRTLASGGGTASGRGELRLWDAERGSPLATLPAEGGPVRQVAFSARGDRLTVLLRRDGQDDRGAATLLEVWSARGPERALLAADTAPIAHLAFSADGARLASEGATRTTTWDLARGRLERAVPTPRHGDDGGTPSALSVRAPRGDVQVFARERTIWVQRGNDVPARLDSADAAYAFHAEPIQSLHLRADGRLLSLGGYEHPRDRPAELIVWDLATRRAVAHAFEPSNVVAALALSPDERTFVTAGALGPALGHAGFVHVWDAERLTVRASLPGHRALVTAVAFSPDGRRLATGDASGFVRVWELR